MTWSPVFPITLGILYSALSCRNSIPPEFQASIREISTPVEYREIIPYHGGNRQKRPASLTRNRRWRMRGCTDLEIPFHKSRLLYSRFEDPKLFFIDRLQDIPVARVTSFADQFYPEMQAFMQAGKELKKEKTLLIRPV